jgi:antitoxin ParD1/3/4
MTTLSLTLTDSLKEFVETQATAAGFASPSDYVEALLREAQKRQAWVKVEALIVEGMQTPARGMTSADWEQLRRDIEPFRPRLQACFGG